jgi:hypothetical protein
LATYDDLFKQSSDKRFLRFENDGESFLLVQTGEPNLVPQRNQDGKIVFLVQTTVGDKYKPMTKGSFDEDEVANFFTPKVVSIPVTVAGKKLKNGDKDEDFEPFNINWELTQDQEQKFKEALLDTGLPSEAGTKYALKRLSSKSKPYTYSIKIIED